jgi:ERCC4-type nuclease
MDVLRALPGVTESNYHQLAAKVLCLQDLFVMSLAAMQAIIGAENGRKLHTFINTQASADLSSSAQCASASHVPRRRRHRYES